MAVNLEMGVDLSSFNSGINQAKAQISAFNATLKFAESSFKATGDAEAAMITKTQALNGKLQAQKSMIQQYAKALEDMKKSGVDETSESYLKLQRQMILAQSSMQDTQAALNGLNASQQEAATSADKLTQSVQGISKKVSLDQIIGGIDRITDGMERAAQRVVQFGQKLWDTIMDSARRADDTATMAEMYGIDLQEFKKMQALVAQGLDTSVETILASQSKLKKGIGQGSKDTLEALREFGLLYESGKGAETFITEDTLQIMWDAGQAIMALGDSVEAEAKQESMAQALFGKSWKELVPLFDKYKTVDEYRAALNGVSVSSEEATLNAAELADKVSALQNSWTQLKDEIIGQVAPGLTQAAGALDSVLNTILEYLQTEEGKEMLNKLGESVAGLFDDLTKINPEDVVNNFVTVFDKLVSGLEWLSKNWSGVETGLIALGSAFAGLKIAEGVLEFVRIINGLSGLTGIGGSGGGLGGVLKSITGGGSASLTAILTAALKASLPVLGTITVATLAITAATVLLGGSFNSSDVLRQAAERGKKDQEELNKFNEEVASKSDNEELKEAHKILSDYIVPQANTTGLEELVDLQEFARRYVAFMRDFADDDLMDKVSDIVFEKGDEFADSFMSAMEKVLANENDYTGESQQQVVDMVTELMYAVRQQMQNEVLKVKLEPDVTGLQAGLNAVTFSANATLNLASGGLAALLAGHSYANGISYVPDTRLALLHPGETVTPAREVASRNFSSNLYVESMIMNNGTDAAGLASAMAAAQRRTMSGYGS